MLPKRRGLAAHDSSILLVVSNSLSRKEYGIVMFTLSTVYWESISGFFSVCVTVPWQILPIVYFVNSWSMIIWMLSSLLTLLNCTFYTLLSLNTNPKKMYAQCSANTPLWFAVVLHSLFLSPTTATHSSIIALTRTGTWLLEVYYYYRRYHSRETAIDYSLFFLALYFGERRA